MATSISSDKQFPDLAGMETAPSGVESIPRREFLKNSMLAGSGMLVACAWGRDRRGECRVSRDRQTHSPAADHVGQVVVACK